MQNNPSTLFFRLQYSPRCISDKKKTWLLKAVLLRRSERRRWRRALRGHRRHRAAAVRAQLGASPALLGEMQILTTVFLSSSFTRCLSKMGKGRKSGSYNQEGNLHTIFIRCLLTWVPPHPAGTASEQREATEGARGRAGRDRTSPDRPRSRTYSRRSLQARAGPAAPGCPPNSSPPPHRSWGRAGPRAAPRTAPRPRPAATSPIPAAAAALGPRPPPTSGRRHAASGRGAGRLERRPPVEAR